MDLPNISIHLGIEVEEIKKLHEAAYVAKSTDSPADCTFLNDANKCLIYPMRPEACRLYPLDTDFGAADVNCGGHAEFHKIVDAFFARRKYATVYNPNRFKSAVRNIPQKQWSVVWRTFFGTKPSRAMIRQFAMLNNCGIISEEMECS